MTTAPPARLRPWALAAIALATLAVATLADRWLWRVLLVEDPAGLRAKDWWQALRAVGYLPTWVFVGAAWVLYDRSACLRAWGAARRGAAVVISAAGSGLIAEIAKAIIRRQRPGADGDYHFDWAGAGVEGLGIGTVSSHAAVAFGGAIMVGVLVPAWRWALLALAAGCALTRVIAGAHFVSDCVAAGWVGYAVALGVRRLFLARGGAGPA